MAQAELSKLRPRLTVHAVGLLTGSVMAYLGPLLSTLSSRGTPQLILYSAQAGASTALPDRLPAGVQALAVSSDGSQLARMFALAGALGRTLAEEPVDTLYLHGLVSGLAFSLVGRARRHAPSRVMLSPHGSSTLPRLPLLRMVLLAFIRHRLRRLPRMAIVTMPVEARWLAGFAEEPVQLLECPVDDAFFLEGRREARHPLLLSSTSSGNARSLPLYVRLAVLLLDERLGLSFNWIGSVAERHRRACKSAGVACFDDLGVESRARRLATCWIYVSLCDDGGYPQRLAEAMAAGVPCVALETDVTRGLLTDGEDGFLCVDVASLLVRIA